MNKTDSKQEERVIDQKMRELFVVIDRLDDAKDRLGNILFTPRPKAQGEALESVATVASMLDKATALIGVITNEVNDMGNELCKFVGDIKIA